MSGQRESNGLRSFSQLIRPWSGQLTIVVILVGFLAIADMVLPWALSLLVDDVFPALADKNGGWELLTIILVSLCIIYVMRNVLFFISRMISVRVSEHVCFDLRQRLFDHMQQLGMDFYKSNLPGKISSRVMDDTFKIQTFIQDKLPTLLRYTIEFQILLILLYIVNWRLALASTIVLPFHLWTYKKFYLPIRDSHNRAQEHLAEAHGSLVETFMGAQVIKGFSAEKRESESFLETIRAGREDQIKTKRFQFTQKVIADLFVGVGTVLLLGYGASEVYAGSMTIGLFLMFFWYVRMLYPSVLEIISGTGHFSQTSACVSRVLEMLDEPVDEIAYDMRTRTQTIHLVGPIELKNVYFAFDKNTSVLKNVNLCIDAGEHIAVTGPSGGGKSTLVSLLPRFNDPTSGKITIGGHDIKDMRLQDVRGMFGVAFQDAFLFNSTILDNLRYAKPSATAQEIIKACKLTGAHEIIDGLPKGYDTRIGDQGVELSHGQKQRINLARALVRKPQTLIIDEITASIEASASKQIIKAVLDHMTGRTVIIVTHDPAILQFVHRVVTLENKTITQSKSRKPISMKHPTTKLGMLLLATSLFFGCSTTTTTSMLSMDQPKSNVIVLDTDDEVDFSELANAIDEVIGDTISITTYADQIPLTTPPIVVTPSEIAALVPIRKEVESNQLFIQLDSMNTTEIGELIELVATKYNLSGYSTSSKFLDGVLSVPPDGVTEHLSIAKKSEESTQIIRIGYKVFLSQPPHIWTEGISIAGDDLSRNNDIDSMQQFVTDSLASLALRRSSLHIGDLGTELIQLSYIDSPTAIELLRGFGITTYLKPSEIPTSIDWTSLPYVALIPDPTPEQTGLVGGDVSSGAFGMSMVPNTASALTSTMVGSPTTQLLVFFDKAHPEHFSEIKRLLDTYIDRPARQIFIEGMVLEINEDGLKDLGIDWNLADSPDNVLFSIGKLNAGTNNDSLSASVTGIDLSRPFEATSQWILGMSLRALLRDGKAEILSRPSVLTLNNRQSTIRVGQDIPIATSTAGITNADMLSFNFKYLPIGIMLNIRPRISADGKEVSMLIDTIVSSTVPGADLEIRDANDILLASAPTISSRRVQTYGRIPNDTPFIIGGLVNKEQHTILDKVPLLADIPLIGGLFQSERTTSTRTEVIIVLTPHVLPVNNRALSAMPKDDKRFDSTGNVLFRDSYRIRKDDVFDLAFIETNEQLQVYRNIAEQKIAKDYTYANNPAFSVFKGGHFPGESILVTRMVYEIIKKQKLETSIPASRLAFFKNELSSGMGIGFLDQAMAKASGSSDANQFFNDAQQKALAIIFEEGETVPYVQLLSCKNEAQWKELLLTLNQDSPSGKSRSSIVIHSAKDIQRLRRAVALKDIVELNNGSEALALDQFHVGQYVLIPDQDPKQVHLLDAEVAKYFYHTEHYYAATLQAIKTAIANLENELSKIPTAN
ncbi:MAG TPA: ATP-binding cassette domain-containing protein [Phycisphaerales bacterium]|nr:ATP-binding cassette domain-containing protein [Phycisphaerales bacterium]HIB50575.1 ATP-binding cassette domain-containing protein [Phycisphaerales bacterium]HIN84134.1 ATP-binding cassette domain-containing protein [Phycisphaerales bacterium]